MELGKIVGRGRSADVYEYGSDTVVKLFKGQYSNSEVEKEYKLHMVVQNYGLPIPKLYDILRFEDKTGLVYQRINGFTMLDDIRSNPSKMPEYSKDTASLHLEISKCTVDDDQLVSVNKQYSDWITWLDILSHEKKQKAVDYINSLPSGNTLCHSDFHADNIMIENGKYYIIDWINVNRGCFAADVMRSSALIEFGSKASDMELGSEIQAGIEMYRKIYLDSILSNSDLSLDDVYRWEIPVLVGKLLDGNPEDEKRLVHKRLLEIL